ncbi:hypothetical protein AMTRI_Chr13g119330 [Amborella trichopoda]|uniref:uncharacterized protein LOC18433847 n=1 Tax=Amborella trichopoda TaxID=13333 RepID=UPI0009BE4E3C|nr:uncharacterized protein LOC18433847 [Amborella trichopoda]|eukprot:XP_020522627.1 uncharacterized protein LOC18433847 [Amborella trichopoda]
MKLFSLALVLCFFFSLFAFSLLRPHSCPAPNVGSLNLKVPKRAGLNMATKDVQISESGSPAQEDEDDEDEDSKPICHVSNPRSEYCEILGDIRIHPNSSTLFFITPPAPAEERKSWKIRPYARKADPIAMQAVKEISIKRRDTAEETPDCSINHTSPAIVFSIGSYTGNLFHDFTDVLVPLFLTSRHYHGHVHFLVSDIKPWWISKYSAILSHLSNRVVIDLDHDKSTHCFPKAQVGLEFHKEFGADPQMTPEKYSIRDFMALLREVYSLGRKNISSNKIEKRAMNVLPAKISTISNGSLIKRKPRLLIIYRKRTRKFLNFPEIVELAKSVGYDVVIGDAEFGTNMTGYAGLVNSCDVMMGVHGAGLTNMVFLPLGAVVIQIIPLGGLQWVGRTSFGEPAHDMKLHYIEYQIQQEESSLIEEYPHNDPVLVDPASIHKHDWLSLRSIYLEKQNVKLDLGRFKRVLQDALHILYEQDRGHIFEMSAIQSNSS